MEYGRVKCRNNLGGKYKDHEEVSAGRIGERSIGTVGEGSKGTTVEGCIWTTGEGSIGTIGMKRIGTSEEESSGKWGKEVQKHRRSELLGLRGREA